MFVGELDYFNMITFTLELLGGFEPPTSSLPRMCSTPELQERNSVIDTITCLLAKKLTY
jgi:hypothetical protein